MNYITWDCIVTKLFELSTVLSCVRRFGWYTEKVIIKAQLTQLKSKKIMIKGYNIGDVITFSKVGKHEHEHINGVEQFCLTCTSKLSRQRRKRLQVIAQEHRKAIAQSAKRARSERVANIAGTVAMFLLASALLYTLAIILWKKYIWIEGNELFYAPIPKNRTCCTPSIH